MKKKLSSKENFGPFIRKLRLGLNIGQRELAEQIGVAPSYLNDIEKEKRSAPKQIVIKNFLKYLRFTLILLMI